MLQSLYIKDFVLIDQLELDFQSGFCVITGETGAGKSILLDAILFGLTGKFEGSPVRQGADSCSVTLSFANAETLNQILAEHDIAVAENLLIRCSQNLQGRKKCYINEQMVTIRLAKLLAEQLIEIHGQHVNTTLLDSSTHLSILDEFAQAQSLVTSVKELYQQWQATIRQIRKIDAERDQIDADIEYLTHICQELLEANISQDEEQELLKLKQDLQHSAKYQQLLNNTISDIDNSGIDSVIIKAQKNLAPLSANQYLSTAQNELEQAFDHIENIKSNLQQALATYQTPKWNLEEIEERLYQIRSLARKHNVNASLLGEFLQKSQAKLAELQNILQDNTQLGTKAEQQEKEYQQVAKLLSERRLKAAETLEQKIAQTLATLGMQKTIFKVQITHNIAGANGIDLVQFIASTNPGSPLAPISEIASGGELARFMLALRVALFDKAPKHTLIFDEVDVGMSGAVADAIGSCLKLLSKAVQVITITHQPQVAGKADQHVLIKKQQRAEDTKILVQTLNDDAILDELARMISGQKITTQSRLAAKQLMN